MRKRASEMDNKPIYIDGKRLLDTLMHHVKAYRDYQNKMDSHFCEGCWYEANQIIEEVHELIERKDNE